MQQPKDEEEREVEHTKRGQGGSRIALISDELKKLGAHIKTYSAGAYPLFCLQTHTILRVQAILDMYLDDLCQCTNGKVCIKKEIIWEEKKIPLNEYVRQELAWYVLQRIQVKDVRRECLEGLCLCVNKQKNPLQKQVYRKMLERASDELGLSRVYNPQYPRSLYGYLEIAYGRKTVDAVAEEYGVERYYLLTRIFGGMDIEYEGGLLDEIANIDRREGGKETDAADA